MKNPIPVVDVFAGCGGLGEGFNKLKRNGEFPFDVRLSIERETAPIRTLVLRAFYHQFRQDETPESYYEYVRGEIDRDVLFDRYPNEADEASRRCFQVNLGNPESCHEINARISQAVNGAEDWVLIGGPPCQAYSTIGRVRNQAIADYDPSSDVRFELYHEYLKIIANHWPAVFVMENVKGLLSASRQNKRIFDQMQVDLKDPARAVALEETSNSSQYRYILRSATVPLLTLGDMGGAHVPTDFVVRTENYGIPQARHRVVIIGVREDIEAALEPLELCPEKVNASQVLGDMPSLRSGLSKHDSPEKWVKAVKDIVNQNWWAEIEPATKQRIDQVLATLHVPYDGRGDMRFLSCSPDCKYKPEWFLDDRLQGVLNHEARTHREDDLWRYLYAACWREENDRPLRINDFPAELKPKHRNVEEVLDNYKFADRFRVQAEDSPARTVVSHIRKDGHYYIHYDPAQCRSLTVREAARLQTFPDNYFFEGSRTDQYGQVGNAVPPLLSYQIAERVASLIKLHREGPNGQDFC